MTIKKGDISKIIVVLKYTTYERNEPYKEIQKFNKINVHA